jgi:hypothetical protein
VDLAHSAHSFQLRLCLPRYAIILCVPGELVPELTPPVYFYVTRQNEMSLWVRLQTWVDEARALWGATDWFEKNCIWKPRLSGQGRLSDMASERGSEQSLYSNSPVEKSRTIANK